MELSWEPDVSRMIGRGTRSRLGIQIHTKQAVMQEGTEAGRHTALLVSTLIHSFRPSFAPRLSSPAAHHLRPNHRLITDATSNCLVMVYVLLSQAASVFLDSQND